MQIVLTIGLCFIYLLAHWVAYALVFRRLPAIQSEKGVFLFHFFSACFLPLAVFGFNFGLGLSFATLCAATALAAHGIYSLSFLELWALSDGSFSYMVLSAIERDPAADERRIVAELSAIADRKKGQRLRTLAGFQLIRLEDDKVALTPRGVHVARAIRAIRGIANLSGTG
jgi:hypothetical protein